MVRITAVENDSPADRAGLTPGDTIETINGQQVEDFLDFLFLTADAELELEYRRAGSSAATLLTLHRTSGESLGLDIDQGRITRCGCNCMFCFVHQLPKGLRRSLYVKDEDYRHSFLYGNYITGSNLRERDLDRIAGMGLSPLYISVHATDEEIRGRMLGGRGRADILSLLDELIACGVELHCQLVLCPGINDGVVLERTALELEALGPEILSLAVVPVGLTAHRRRLPALEPVTPAGAAETLRAIHRLQRGFRRKRGGRFVFAADEFYILSGSRLPSAASCEGYPQLENGIGLVRSALSELDKLLRRIGPGNLSRNSRINFLTGKLFAPVFRERFLPRIEKVLPASWRVTPVANRLLGDSITVAGLLCGRDIIAAVRKSPPADIYLLPGAALNEDRLFLDDMTLDQLRGKLAPARAIAAGSPAGALELMTVDMKETR